MKKYFPPIIVVFAILLFQIKLIAQNAEVVSIEQAIETYNSKHLPEKIYVHTDKSVYLNNELCWFKIYSLEGFFHTPLNINKVAYIELLDANQKAVLQEKIGLKNATGTGSLQLPATLPSGKYTLIAYTNWMKNFDPGFFFKKTITVINTQNINENQNAKTNTNFILNIFPESGQALIGVESNIAFSITDVYGKGLNTKGKLINSNGTSIINFNTKMNGIGDFVFTPAENESYKLIVETPNGIIEKNLPTIIKNGYGIHVVSMDNNALKIDINKTVTDNHANYLIIHSRGIIKKAMQLNLNQQLNSLTFPLDALAEGINTITLFDASKKPVAERLFFKFPAKDANEINIESNLYKKRTKVNLNINAFSNIPYDASIAVYKIDSLQNIDEMNMQNYLLLSSDLIGKIENPQRYFDTTNTNRFVEMDNLMLTHGWRRFNYENLVQNENPSFKYLPEIGGSLITGKILIKGTQIPAKETAGFLSVPSKNTVFKSATSDQNGKIVFQFDEFNNDGQIIVIADSIKTQKNKIEIDNPFLGKNIPSQSDRPIDINQLPKEEVKSWHRNVQVQNYYTPQFANNFGANLQDTNAFYYTPDRTYYLDDYARFNSLEEVIREYVTPVTLVKEKGKYQLYVYDEAYKQFFEQSPLVLLDGVIIKDIDKFLEYDPLKIRKLEVVSRVYFSGNLAYNGIINFTTYAGKLEGFELDPNAVVLDYKGLQSKRIFNAPVYENNTQLENRIPDFRNLLYWKTDATLKKNSHFSFYTSDLNGKYIVSVQGINKEGKTINLNAQFEVK
jgi:hypothetical protein